MVDKHSAIPLYSQLIAALEKDIDTGRLPPGGRMPSELELAAHHQVSRTTARQALQRLSDAGLVVRIQGKGTFVRALGSPEASRDPASGEEQPGEPVAPSLRPRPAIRMVQYRDGDDILFDRTYQNLVRGAERQARDTGLDLILSSCLECEEDLESLVSARTENGMILYGEFQNGFANQIARLGVPAVAIDEAANGGESIDTVRVDQRAAMRQAVQYLLQRGHRVVGYIGGARMSNKGEVLEWKASRLRWEAYNQAMRDAGLKVCEDHMLTEFSTQRHAYRAARRMLDRIHKPTAVIAFSPSIALGVHVAAKERDLYVPDDLSILTFSESEHVCFEGDRSFTTIWSDTREAGAQAVRMLLARNDAPTRPPQTVVMPTTLNPGHTVASPRRPVLV